MRLLIVTSVPAEAEAIAAPGSAPGGAVEGAEVIVGGIGRTNAAAATTEAVVRAAYDARPIEAVMCAGVAGALPNGGLALGDVVVASCCVYAEEGIMGLHGFADMAGLGFTLGDFAGNGVPVDGDMLEALGEMFRVGVIATVATCSGTAAAAEEVVRRTGAVAEAMEGAAVVHAARRLGVPAIELRVVSNTTGDRSSQRWDLSAALRALGPAVVKAAARLRAGA